MKKILILLLLLACKEPDNMSLVISDASEIHFTPTGESSFNLEQLGYIDNQYCFHEKFLCSGERKFQGYDVDGGDYSIFAYDEDGVEIWSSVLAQTSYQLFDPLEDWTEFGGGTAWDGIGTDQPSVTLGSGSVYSNSIKTNIVPPPDVSVRVVYDIDNSTTLCDLIFRFRSGGSAVTPLPAAIPLPSGNTSGYFDILLDAPADDFYMEIQKASGAGTTITPNSIKLYRTSKVDDTVVYRASVIPSDEGMCDKFVDFKIKKVFVTNPVTNPGFDTSISPWMQDLTGSTWAHFGGSSAQCTNPSKRLYQNVKCSDGVYTLAYANSRSISFGTCIVTFSTMDIDGNVLESIVIPNGSGTVTFDGYYLGTQVRRINIRAGGTFLGTVTLTSLDATATGDDEEIYYSDDVEFVSDWANSSSEGRVDIQYKANQNTDDGLIYDGGDPYFMIQVDGQFAQADFETVEKEMKLTRMSFNTATSFQEKMKLIINDSPRYQHRKIILALQHAAVGTVLVNGEEISLGAGYTLGTDRPATYPQRPAEILLNLKNSYKHNVL